MSLSLGHFQTMYKGWSIWLANSQSSLTKLCTQIEKYFSLSARYIFLSFIFHHSSIFHWWTFPRHNTRHDTYSVPERLLPSYQATLIYLKVVCMQDKNRFHWRTSLINGPSHATVGSIEVSSGKIEEQISSSSLLLLVTGGSSV